MIKLDNNTDDVNNTCYNYLTRMPIDSLTRKLKIYLKNKILEKEIHC